MNVDCKWCLSQYLIGRGIQNQNPPPHGINQQIGYRLWRDLEVVWVSLTPGTEFVLSTQ